MLKYWYLIIILLMKMYNMLKNRQIKLEINIKSIIVTIENRC